MPLYAEKNAYLFHRIYFITYLILFSSLSRVIIIGVIPAIVRPKKIYFSMSFPYPPHRPVLFFRLFIGLMGIWIARFCRGQLLPKRLSSKLIGGFYRKTVFIIWSYIFRREIPFDSPCFCRIHAFLY